MSKIECHECGVEMGADSSNPQIAYCLVDHIGGYVCDRCPVPAPDDTMNRAELVAEANRLVLAKGGPECTFAACSDDSLRQIIDQLRDTPTITERVGCDQGHRCECRRATADEIAELPTALLDMGSYEIEVWCDACELDMDA